MITKITVDGFKSLADFEIELGQVNVLIGANGSGKTNILEAIGVLGAAASGRVDGRRLPERGVRLSGAGRYQSRLAEVPTLTTITMKAEWESGGKSAAYEVALEPPANGNVWRYAEERGSANGQPILDRAGAPNGALDPDAGWAALKRVELGQESAARELLLWLDGYAIWAPNTPTLRGIVQDPQQRHPLGLSGGGLADAVRHVESMSWEDAEPGEDYVADALSDALGLTDWALGLGADERSESLISPDVPSGRLVVTFLDRFMAEGSRKLPAYECSEGALYVLAAAALAVSSPPPSLLAIDDFDHALNPRLARALVECFCEWVTKPAWGRPGRQVLITTHNPLILDGLDLTDDRIRLFAVDRTSKGRTVARRVVVDQKLMEKSEGEWPLSRLWVRGEIGGMPRV